MIARPIFGARVTKVETTNHTAQIGEGIRCNIAWKNNTIIKGASVHLYFLLGKGGYLYHFNADGVNWYIGAAKSDTAPDPGKTVTNYIFSNAFLECPAGAFDAAGIIANQLASVQGYPWQGRIVGVRIDQFHSNNEILGVNWFENVLTVIP